MTTKIKPPKTIETYELQLPYFKQGDDLGFFLTITTTPSEAFLAHAEMLEGTAKLLRRVAAVAVECPGIEVDADCHMISVTGPVAGLAGLVQDEILSKFTCFDEDGDGEDGDEEE